MIDLGPDWISDDDVERRDVTTPRDGVVTHAAEILRTRTSEMGNQHLWVVACSCGHRGVTWYQRTTAIGDRRSHLDDPGLSDPDVPR